MKETELLLDSALPQTEAGTEVLIPPEINTEQPTEACAAPTAEKKRWTIFGAEVVYLYLLGIGMAFIGWIAENTVKAISDGYIDSRFHVLPFRSPYALIPFALHIALGNADDLAFFGKKVFKKKTLKTKILSNVITAVTICGAVFLGELAVGNLWDKAFGVKLWNYSNLPLQVTQYAGLIPSLGYGLGAYILFKFVQCPLLRLLQRKCPFRVAKIIDLTLGVVIVLDTLAMVLQIIIFNQAPLLWKLYLR